MGVGTTSPDSSNKLQVAGDFAVSWDANKFIGMKFASGTAYKMGLVLNNTTRECKVWSQSSDSDDKITFYTGPTPSERMRIDSSGNVLVGTTGQIKSSKQSIYSGATNATTYNTASFQGGSVLTVQNQQTTSVSTSATVIATTGIYATLALVYGSDGTNRFQDLIMVGLATGTVNVINSFTVGGTPASRTYSQSSSTYRLQMGSGTYTVQFSGLSQGD